MNKQKNTQNAAPAVRCSVWLGDLAEAMEIRRIQRDMLLALTASNYESENFQKLSHPVVSFSFGDLFVDVKKALPKHRAILCPNNVTTSGRIVNYDTADQTKPHQRIARGFVRLVHFLKLVVCHNGVRIPNDQAQRPTAVR